MNATDREAALVAGDLFLALGIGFGAMFFIGAVLIGLMVWLGPPPSRRSGAIARWEAISQAIDEQHATTARYRLEHHKHIEMQRAVEERNRQATAVSKLH